MNHLGNCRIFVAVCLCIATHIQAAGIADEPDRYNKLIETTIKSLEKRKKWVEDNLIKFKTPNSASNNQTVTALGSLSVQQTLTAEKRSLMQRIKSLQEEKNNLAKSGRIKNSTQEDNLIKIMTLNNSIYTLDQQIVNARHLEQFIDNQERGKTAAELNHLESLKRKTKQRLKELELKINQQRAQLKNVSNNVQA